MRIQQLTEQPRRVAAVAFGRMNPPTIGHAKLVDAVKSQAGDPYIFLSQSQKPKTDPLSFEQKIGFAKAFFPGVNVGDPEVRTIFDALNKIYAMGYTDLVYVAGSDRVQQFTDLINKYNGQEDFYSFDSIQVVSAGERDPDAEGAEGMSASKMRAAAVAGDFEAFKSGTPNLDMAQNMYDAVRTGMGMMESLGRIIEVASRLRQLHEVKPLTENVKRAFGIVVEAWSEKYKRSIDCNNPKGFSQRAHCQGRKKNEGKSPHKKGTKKYKAHMAAMHAGMNESVDYVKPQFDVEWEEANRYDYLEKLGQAGWIELANKGKPVKVTKDSVKKIGNTGADGSETLDDLEPEKVERLKKAMKSSTIEMPIVVVQPDGSLDLVAGNTRLIGLISEYGEATVWLVNAMDLTEGKSKEGSYLLQLERDKDLLVLHIKNTQTGQRTEVRGKPNYEGDGYDSDDKLHQLLDKIGKAANMSELMNGEVVSINPRHPDGPEAKERVKKVVGEAGVGRITKQNATKDAPIGSEFANVKKLGLGSGKPKELHAKARKNSDPNTLFNLGLTEGQLNEKGSIGIPLSSGMTVVIAPHRPLKVKKSKKKVKLVGAGGEE